MSQMLVVVPMVRAKASVEPSGDHAGDSSRAEPAVSWVSLVPLALTTQMSLSPPMGWLRTKAICPSVDEPRVTAGTTEKSEPTRTAPLSSAR